MNRGFGRIIMGRMIVLELDKSEKYANRHRIVLLAHIVGILARIIDVCVLLAIMLMVKIIIKCRVFFLLIVRIAEIRSIKEFMVLFK